MSTTQKKLANNLQALLNTAKDGESFNIPEALLESIIKALLEVPNYHHMNNALALYDSEYVGQEHTKLWRWACEEAYIKMTADVEESDY